MSNLLYIECRIRGHKTLCEQEATLYPEGGGKLDHRHRCLRCGETSDLGSEDLPPEVEAMLRMTFAPEDRRIVVDMNGSREHHARIH